MNRLYRTFRSYLDDFIFSFSQNRKLALTYLAGLVPAVLYLGMICFVGKSTEADFFLKSLQIFTFLSAGFFHVDLLGRKISFQRLQYFGGGLVYTILLSVLVSITLLIFYLFADNSMAVMAIGSGIAFVIPHLLLHSWFLFKNIPPKQYPVWTHPSDAKNINDILIPEIITFKFLLPPRERETEQKEYFKTVPIEYKLGKVFYSMIESEEDKNEQSIEFKDSNDNLYGWEFYSFSLKGTIKKRLEPEDTLSDNSIRNNSIVYVKRTNLSPIIHTVQYRTISTGANMNMTPDKNLAGIYTNK